MTVVPSIRLKAVRWLSVIAIPCFATDCDRRVDDTATASLIYLAVNPKQLPDSCNLSWRVAPQPLAMADDSAYFSRIVQFWTAPAPATPSADLEVGLSNVYAGRESDNAAVVLGVKLRTDTAAERLHQLLEARWHGSPLHRVYRSGRLVLASSYSSEVPRACVELLWAEVRRRAQEHRD